MAYTKENISSRVMIPECIVNFINAVGGIAETNTDLKTHLTTEGENMECTSLENGDITPPC